jgi:hypothetical protein
MFKWRLTELTGRKGVNGQHSGVDFLSQGVVNNNFPVTPEMYRRREAELARVKGMEVQDIP